MSIEHVSFHEDGNSIQFNSTVWMDCIDGDLIMVNRTNDTKWRSDLSGVVAKVGDAINPEYDIGIRQGNGIIGLIDGHLIYWQNKDANDSELYSYDIHGKTKQRIQNGHPYQRQQAARVNGNWNYALCYSDSYEKKIKAIRLTGLDAECEYVDCASIDYLFKEACLSIQLPQTGIIENVVYSNDGIEYELMLSTAKRRSIIPMENGWIVHNEGYQDLVYWVESNGKSHVLFSIDCMSSKSAVNVCDGYVYISVERYEGYNDIFRKRFENDEIEGTYKIDPGTGDIQKITDKIFDGLYVFESNRIFCCDKYGNVFAINTIDNSIIQIIGI